MISKETIKYLILGDGFISGEVQSILTEQGEKFTVSKVRLEDSAALAKVLDDVAPTHVINAAGQRGIKNVDWCEDHRLETIEANILGALNVVSLCHARDIHVTHFGSGCIYEFDEEHTIYGKPHVELDTPNFTGSFYAYTKVISEAAIKHYPNVLILRIRFPVAANLDPKNHLTKLLNYDRLVDLPNSGSILPNLLPGALIMAKHNEVGVYNFTNPGLFSNNAIMQSFKKNVRPALTWTNFSETEQGKVLKAPRSNCSLDSSKLVNKLREYDYEILDVHTAMDQAFASMKAAGFT